MKPDGETQDQSLQGDDVLRALDEPVDRATADDRQERRLRVLVKVLRERDIVLMELIEGSAEKLVRILVFQGCAPVLLLMLIFIFCALWAKGHAG